METKARNRKEKSKEERDCFVNSGFGQDDISDCDTDDESWKKDTTDIWRPRLTILTLSLSCLAVAIAFSTWYSIHCPKQEECLKSDTEHVKRHELLELKEQFTQRLARLETGFRGLKKNMKKLESVLSDCRTAQMMKQEHLEDFVKVMENELSSDLDVKMYTMYRKIQEELQVLTDEVSHKCGSIGNMQEEQSQLGVDGINLKVKSGKLWNDDTHSVQLQLHPSQDNMGRSGIHKSRETIKNRFKFLARILTDAQFKNLAMSQMKHEKGPPCIRRKKENVKKLGNEHDIDDTAKPMKKENLDKRTRETKKAMLDKIPEKMDKMRIQIPKGSKTTKDEVSDRLNSLNDSLTEHRCIDVMNWTEAFGKKPKSVAIQTSKMAMHILQVNTTLGIFRDLIERHSERVKILTENVIRDSSEIIALNKRMEYIEENTLNKRALEVVIMVDNIIITFLLIYIFGRGCINRNVDINFDIRQERAFDGESSGLAPYSTAGRILRQVRVHTCLERKLCIISFCEETHPLHMRMTRSATQQLNLEHVEFIIRRHGDILIIPPVTIYFLFVDFNERNVILEDPKVGLGDLRLTTVQAIQKMGGKLAILYVRDPKSKKLDPGKLYNGDLLSVTRQRELSSLNQFSRFFSAFDTLSDNQIAHLRQILSYELGRY